jgi:excisionase family DNA binding protein
MILQETIDGQTVAVQVIERHYKVSEAAALLGVSCPYVYERINNGTFTVVEMGDGRHFQRIPASSLQAFIDARTYGGNKSSGVRNSGTGTAA